MTNLLPKDKLWEAYDKDNEKGLDEKIYKKLGKYNFIKDTVFDITSNSKFINTEIQDNDLKTCNIDEFKSVKQCKKCKSYKIHSMPWQTRSADEAIPTKHSCLRCGRVEFED